MTAVAGVAAILFVFASGARAEMTISTSQPNVAAGSQLEVNLIIANDGAEPLTIEVPSPLHMHFDTSQSTSILQFVPERSGQLVVASRAFLRIKLSGVIPNEAEGVATLAPTGLQTNPLLLQIGPAAPSDSLLAGAASNEQRSTGADSETSRSTLIDKPPPLAVSVYEPVYFLIGGDDGLNAKFQISFRYRLFDNRGALAEKLPWIDNLYLSYSQTSLWDLDDLSKPFRDSSYRPRLFFSNYDLQRLFDGRLRIGFEAGVGHESNGKDGEDSRSFNMAYLRPALTFGDPEGLRAYAAPLIHNYVSDDENPNLSHYRGYIDWVFGIGSKGGLDFAATLRKGTRSDYGSLEVSASYPLSKLSGGDLTGWLMLQYFGGYGESLLDFDRKLDTQLRLGIAVAL